MVATEMKNHDNIAENLYPAVFGVADYKSVIIYSTFRMAYSKRRLPK